jgi:dipeptidyl aminopeptidase/acylaminoacyl peptidase
MASNSSAVYAPWGELLWWQDGHVRAQPFDPDRLELSGEPRLFQPEVAIDPRIGFGMFSVAHDSTFVYRGGGIIAGDELARVDRSGRDLGTIGEPGNFYHPRLSPDGSMVAVDRSDVSNRGDIWIYDVARGSGTRFTSAPEDESVPVWSPDGRQLALTSNRVVGNGAVHLRPLRGRGDERVIYGSESISASPWSWTEAGLVIEYVDGGAGSRRDVGVYSIEDGTFTPHLTTQFAEMNAVISPDGRLLAYQSDETGRFEIYVETYPEAVDRWRVSNDGGVGPKWRRDGRELFYIRDERSLMAVPVRVSATGAAAEIGTPELLFATVFKPGTDRQQFDTLDGETFVVNRSVGDRATAPLTLVVNVAGR